MEPDADRDHFFFKRKTIIKTMGWNTAILKWTVKQTGVILTFTSLRY